MTKRRMTDANETTDLASSPEETVRRRTGGRSARVREAVLRATLDTLTELGLESLNFSEISRRAGVHATSIQRRWGTRENVLLEALLTYSDREVAIPDTGSLRGDLNQFARTLRDTFASRVGSMILQALVDAKEENEDTISNRNAYMRRRQEAAMAIITRANQRGEIRADVDLRLLLEVALAPVYARPLVLHQPADDRYIEAYLDMLLQGVRSRA